MSHAIAIAASGLKVEAFNLDRISHDLANMNTNNYKSTRLQFADLVYQPVLGQEDRFAANSVAKIGLGTSLLNTSKNFSPGSLKATANWNDVAINGDGFFQIIREDGETAYTRASTLSIDSERYLITSTGERLSDSIQIPEEFVKVTIQKNGNVEVTLPEETEPQVLGSVKLAKFMNPEGLRLLGNGMYSETESSGSAIIDTPGQSGLGELIQGQVETSNVDMVDSLMQLTLAQRIYQINAKAVQIADEMEKEINELRA